MMFVYHNWFMWNRRTSLNHVHPTYMFFQCCWHHVESTYVDSLPLTFFFPSGLQMWPYNLFKIVTEPLQLLLFVYFQETHVYRSKCVEGLQIWVRLLMNSDSWSVIIRFSSENNNSLDTSGTLCCYSVPPVCHMWNKWETQFCRPLDSCPLSYIIT